jgi:hypothetical protein
MPDQNWLDPYQQEVAAAENRKQDALRRAFDDHRSRVEQARKAHAARLQAAEMGFQAAQKLPPADREFIAARAALDAVKGTQPDLKPLGDVLAAMIREVEATHRDELARLGKKHRVVNGVQVSR